MAGVIASAFAGFASTSRLKPQLMSQLKKATSVNVPAAHKIRNDVDTTAWHLTRNAVHKQVAAELETREANAVLCERPTKIDINGNRVTMEFRDGWPVG
jgi:hypothetical protein